MKYKDAEKRLKKIAKGRYCCLEYERTYNTDGKETQECKMYIDEYGWCGGSTWNQVFKEYNQKNSSQMNQVNDKEAPLEELKKEKE